MTRRRRRTRRRRMSGEEEMEDHEEGERGGRSLIDASPLFPFFFLQTKFE